MKRTVLYVDDEADNRVVFEAALDDVFHVLTADSAEAALDLLASQSVPVVVADQRMPGTTGIDLFDVLRVKHPQTRRILLTAYTEPSAMIDAVNRGQVFYFLQKPWERSTIEPVLVRAIEAHDLATTLEQQSEVLARQNDELRAMKAHLEQANQLKSNFLANMSHEIRSPMTSILGFAELLRDHLSDARERDIIDTIKRNGEYLLDIINDILDLSKIEADSLKIEPRPCSPRDIVTEVAALMHARCEAKKLWLEVAIDDTVPGVVRSDPLRLRQILVNLVGNAVKFTDRGGVRVDVRTEKKSAATSHLHFDIRDSGIGIAAERLDSLFQSFSQVDSSLTRRFGGTGLGLVISRRLAQMLGGDITVQSVPGQGSTFSLTIAIGNYQTVSSSSDVKTPAIAPSTADETADVSRLSTARILLAEDGPDNQRLLSFILRGAGADVTVAGNGQEAVDEVAQSIAAPFDLVLMDMHMPLLDGYQATSELRRMGYRGPVIAVTAHAMAGDRQKCLDAGCNEVVTKPFERARLLSLISYCLEQRDLACRETFAGA